MSIGKRLEELIIYRNTNVNKVAKAAGISPQTIYGIIKRDNTKVDINILMALAEELDVTLNFFSGGEIDEDTFDTEALISKYSRLDDFGKKAVQTLVDVELERARAQGKVVDLPEDAEEVEETEVIEEAAEVE